MNSNRQGMNSDEYSQKLPGISVARFFIALAFSCAGLQSVGAAENSQVNGQLAAYRLQIEDLEFRFGPYHDSLIEPLQSMIQLLQEKGDHEQVADIQNRQLQLMRTVLGFQHPDLIPVVQSIIANQILLGNWEDISDHLEHIRHLQASRDSDDPGRLLTAIDDQINWLFSRIALEDRRYSVRNFFKTRDLYEEMEDLAEDKYGKNNPEAAPWLYKVAYNNFHLVQFLNGSRGTGSESIDRLVRQEGSMKLQSSNRNFFGNTSIVGNSSFVPVVDGDRPLGHAYLRDGYSLVRDIEDLLQEHGDLEAQAMAKIYRADYQLLSDRGSAIRNYRKAQEMLVEAGVAEEAVRWFFERPMIIPMDTLYIRLQDAIADLNSKGAPIEPAPGDAIHLGVFTAWLDALDSTPMPTSKDPFWQLDLPYRYADISFSVSSRGKASSVDVLATGPDGQKTGRRSIWRAVRDIHFRPAIIDGRTRRMKDVHMRYRFLDE